MILGTNYCSWVPKRSGQYWCQYCSLIGVVTPIVLLGTGWYQLVYYTSHKSVFRLSEAFRDFDRSTTGNFPPKLNSSSPSGIQQSHARSRSACILPWSPAYAPKNGLSEKGPMVSAHILQISTMQRSSTPCCSSPLVSGGWPAAIASPSFDAPTCQQPEPNARSCDTNSNFESWRPDSIFLRGCAGFPANVWPQASSHIDQISDWSRKSRTAQARQRCRTQNMSGLLRGPSITGWQDHRGICHRHVFPPRIGYIHDASDMMSRTGLKPAAWQKSPRSCP